MAGGDLRFFQQHIEELPGGIFPLVRLLNASILNLQRMQKPVVACVHGSVAGVGMSFMMAADLVIAGANTKFTMAYNKIGISPDGGASYFLPHIVGSKKAAELILLSEIFDATTAQQLGLVNWVVDDAQLAEDTGKLLKKLAQGPTRTFANSKQLIQQASFHSLEQHLEAEAASFAQLSTTHDFRAGLSGFLKKEKPTFRGE
jgi:2-(1,2-epoxy-1,2-dihydrophenyl)acetyl-CoA isomerase